MNRTFWTYTVSAAAACGLLASTLTVSAQSVDIFTEDLSAFNSTTDLGDGIQDGVIVTNATPGACPFGTGNAVRYFDFNPSDKPETQGELPSAIQGPFQISFQSCNQSMSTNGGPAIRWRMANTGKSISSGGRSAFSLSWHANQVFSASYLSSSNTTESLTSPAQAAGVHDITLVGNDSLTGTYEYSLFGESRTLNPVSYDIYIDGTLFNNAAQFSGGLGFSTNNSVANYDASLGLKRFGLIGSADGEVDPDVWYDNIVMNIGEIPIESEILLVDESATEAFMFTSTSGTVYSLQSSTNAMDAIPIWVDAGLEVVGDGGDQLLFDPAGFDSNKTYRIIEVQ